MIRKIRCVLLCLLITTHISACSLPSDHKKQDTHTGIVNYEEKILTESSSLKTPVNMKINSKNQLVVYEAGSSKEPVYKLLNPSGKPEGEIKCSFTGDGSLFTLDTQDNLWVLTQNTRTDGAAAKPKSPTLLLYVFKPSGEQIKSLDLACSKESPEDTIIIRDMTVDSKGNIYLLRSNKRIEVLDKEGKSTGFIGNGSYDFFDIDPEGNLVTARIGDAASKSYIEKLNSANGQSIWKKELEFGDFPRAIKSGKADTHVYFASDKGVKRFDAAGENVEDIFDFKTFSILSFNNYISNMVLDSSNSLYFITRQVGNTQSSSTRPFELFKYSLLDGKTEQKSPKVLTLSTWRSNRFLETSSSMFHARNPDIRIEIKEYAASGNDLDKFMKGLNLDIMSGKSYDILEVSSLPYKKYIDKNIFVNLSDIIKKDKSFDANQYYTNILDAFKYRNNLYILPVSFGFQGFCANKSVLEQIGKFDDSRWTWEDFAKVSEMVIKDLNNDGTPDQYALPAMTYNDLFVFLFRSNYSKFVDEKNKRAAFTSKEFEEFLNFSKSFVDKKMLHPQARMGDTNTMYNMTNRGLVVFYPFYFNKFSSMYKSLYNGNGTAISLPVGDNGEGRSFIADAYAITRSSKHKDEAWKFLKYLVSEEIQAQSELFRLPVHKEAFKKRAKEDIEMSAKRTTQNSGTAGAAALTEEDFNTYEKMIQDLKQHASIDQQIIQIATEEVKTFFTDEKSAREVSSLIQSRVETYLKE